MTKPEKPGQDINEHLKEIARLLEALQAYAGQTKAREKRLRLAFALLTYKPPPKKRGRPKIVRPPRVVKRRGRQSTLATILGLPNRHWDPETRTVLRKTVAALQATDSTLNKSRAAEVIVTKLLKANHKHTQGKRMEKCKKEILTQLAIADKEFRCAI